MATELTAKDVMYTDLVKLKPDQSIYDAMDALLQRGISGAPVVDDAGAFIGILSEKDCLGILAHGTYYSLPDGLVSAYMTTVHITVTPETDIFAVADIFLRNSFRRLPVIDNGRLVGQISRRDVLRAVLAMKNELTPEPEGDHSLITPSLSHSVGVQPPFTPPHA